jgi:hypothetical protein
MQIDVTNIGTKQIKPIVRVGAHSVRPMPNHSVRPMPNHSVRPMPNHSVRPMPNRMARLGINYRRGLLGVNNTAEGARNNAALGGRRGGVGAGPFMGWFFFFIVFIFFFLF